MLFENFNVTLHNFGNFRLDGGAMFGSVPKNLWAKKIKPDDENCIPLATRCMLIQFADKKVLVDVGLGEKWNDKQRQIFAIDNVSAEKVGIDRESITDVILTHLHFDHAGGISYFDEDGELKLSYPNATVHVQQSNFENATSPGPREKASYLKENVSILKQAKLNLLSGEVEVLPRIWVHQIDGHTRGQQWVEIRGAARSIVFPTDLIPTSHHLPVAFNMGYDICAETVLREKQEFLQAAMDKKHVVVFEHDREIAAGLIGQDEKGNFCLIEEVKF